MYWNLNKIAHVLACILLDKKYSLLLGGKLVNISSGDGLVPSDNQPLPGPMLSKIHDIIWFTINLKSATWTVIFIQELRMLSAKQNTKQYLCPVVLMDQ